MGNYIDNDTIDIEGNVPQCSQLDTYKILENVVMIQHI